MVAVIATRDRPDNLARLLTVLAAITPLTGVGFRAIVIDNSPRETARAVVDRFAGQLDLLYRQEPRQGAGRAKNAALDCISRSDIVCVLDDDVVPPVDYLARVQAVVDRHGKNLGMIGGRVELYDSRDQPITIRIDPDIDYYDGSIRLFGFLHGCCAVIPGDVLLEAGGFDPNLGPGSVGYSGDDTDLSYRLWRRGLTVVYDPELFLYHDHGRRTHEERAALMARYQQGQGAVYAKHLAALDGHAYAMVFRLLLSDIRISFKSLFSARKDRVPFAVRWYRRATGATHYLRNREPA